MLRRPHRPHEDEEEQWEDAKECPHVKVGDVGDLGVRNYAFLLHKEMRRDNLWNLILEADVEGVDCEQDDQHRSRLRRTDSVSKNYVDHPDHLTVRAHRDVEEPVEEEDQHGRGVVEEDVVPGQSYHQYVHRHHRCNSKQPT